ncbi:MAG: nucleotide sugar dehydrogenase [Acetobacteraceae bacterium]|nr:nucleotide sugar dehydrogenase [Acetobacteraceae bacterium]
MGSTVIGCDIDPRGGGAGQRGQAAFPRTRPRHAARRRGADRSPPRAGRAPAEAEAFLHRRAHALRARTAAPDLSHVEAATAAIAPLLRPGDLVVLESTVPVGTTERIWPPSSPPRGRISPSPATARAPPPGAVHLAHCPERVLPGAILRELAANDRVVGGLSQACAARARALYERFVTGDIHLTDCRTAELVKLAENAFRDVNIAFANELAAICDRIGVDVWRAIRLANCHPRVAILRPGAGVGGHCIPLDPWFLVASAPEEARLIRAAREVNDCQAAPRWRRASPRSRPASATRSSPASA